MIPNYNKLIPKNPTVQEIGGVKQLGLGNEYAGLRSMLRLGLTISVSVLILFILVKNFNIGTTAGVTRYRRFESYKSILFAISGFFTFLLCAPGVKNKTAINNFKCAAFSWITCVISIVIYENLYHVGESAINDIVADILMTTILLIVCWIENQFISSISKDSTPLMF